MKTALTFARPPLLSSPVNIRELFREELTAEFAEHPQALRNLQSAIASAFMPHSSAGHTAIRDSLFALGMQSFVRLVVEQTAKVAIQETLQRILGSPGDLQGHEWDDQFIRQITGSLVLIEGYDGHLSFPFDIDRAARPLIVDCIKNQLVPALAFWSDLSEGQDPGAWAERYVYFLDEILLKARTVQLLDLIMDWPASTPAVSDLKAALDKTDARVYVSRALSEALKRRLLHPGARTRDVLQIYVSLVYAVRFIDPHGVILSRVVSPIRRYLRGRPDTVAVIVSSLLGDGDGVAELRSELDAASRKGTGDADPIEGISAGNAAADTTIDVTIGEDDSRALISTMFATSNSSARTASAARIHGENAVTNERIIDYSDPNWRPRPIDAGPNYRQTQGADVIAMLVSIFDDRASFVKALEVSTARALLKSRGYDISQEYRNNEVLKRRFGDAALSRCDVMLQDVLDSRRVDQSIWQLLRAPESALSANTRRRLPPEKVRRAAANDDTLQALKPLVTSRHFWPDLEGSETAMVGALSGGSGSGNVSGTSGALQPATLASVGPPPGGLDLKLPGSLGRAMEAYNRCFTAVRESRRLRWLSGYGSIEVKVEMKDGRSWAERVDPIKASVLVAASEEGASPERPLSKAHLMEDMGFSRADTQALSLMNGAFTYWVSKNVLVEVEGHGGWYVECFVPGSEGTISKSR